jgi:hypothetical protein
MNEDVAVGRRRENPAPQLTAPARRAPDDDGVWSLPRHHRKGAVGAASIRHHERRARRATDGAQTGSDCMLLIEGRHHHGETERNRS